MNLMKCPVCGELYSPSYRRCPFCEEMRGKQHRRGRRVPEEKRALSVRGPLIAVLILVLAIMTWCIFGGKLVDRSRDIEPGTGAEDPTVGLPVTEPPIEVGNPSQGDEPIVDEPIVEEPIVEEPDPLPSVDYSGVVLSSEDFTLKVGETHRITLSAEVDGVSWRSGDAGIASVEEDGTVRALSAGMTKVYASFGGRELECIVRVKGAAVSTPVSTANAAFNKTDITLKIGEKYTLKITGTTASATWSVGNSKIATVASDGTVKGVAVGMTVVTAKVGDKTLKCDIHVKK